MWDRRESSGNMQMDCSGNGEGPSNPMGSCLSRRTEAKALPRQKNRGGESTGREPLSALYLEDQR